MALVQRRLVRLAPLFFFFLLFLSTALLLLLAIPTCELQRGPCQRDEAFPRCSMDSCFNFSRCPPSQPLLVYTYNTPQPLLPKPTYMHTFPSSIWHTSDPHKACLFFYFSDSQQNEKAWIKPRLSSLPLWNNGLNHVIVTFADRWSDTNPPPHSIGKASILGTNLRNSSHRPGFDISIPLPRLNVDAPQELASLKPFERKYFLTFKGTRYLSREGDFRSSAAFRGLHNDADVIVATTCRHETNDKLLRWQPWRGKNCEEDQALYEKYDYGDLLNCTFGLAPAGRSPASYRMLEVLSAGAIPVLIGAENYVKPFSGLIEWERCLLDFGSSEIQQILPVLREMEKAEVEARQRYCQKIVDQFLKNDNVLLQSVMRLLEGRLLGTFPSLESPLVI